MRFRFRFPHAQATARHRLLVLTSAVLLLSGMAGSAGDGSDAGEQASPGALPFPGVQRVLFEADVDTALAVDALEGARLGPALSRDTALVRVSAIGDVETVSLSEARTRLDRRDPRRDEYIERLPRLFDAKLSTGAGETIERYSVVYLFFGEDEDENQGNDKAGDGRDEDASAGPHTHDALDTALSAYGISSGRWIALDSPAVPEPAGVELEPDAAPLFPVFLIVISASAVAALASRALTDRRRLTLLLLTIALVGGAGVFPVTAPVPSAGEGQGHERSRGCIEVRPNQFNASDWEPGAYTARSDRGDAADAGSGTPLLLIVPEPSGPPTVSGGNAPVHDPERLFRAARSDFNSEIGRHPVEDDRVLLPDFGLLIAHRAYQDGLAWGRTFSVPEPGERLFRPRAEQLGSNGSGDQAEKSGEVVVDYSVEWLRDQLDGDGNLSARLLAATAGRAPLIFRGSPVCRE